MNLDWIKTLIVALGLIIAGFLIGNTHTKAIKANRSVQVKGLAEREVPADLAVWPIEVTITSNNLTALKTTIDKQQQEVLTFFGEQGFNESEFAIGPTNIQDSKATSYGNPNQTYRYIAKLQFTVRTGDIAKLQAALTASLDLIAKGILIGSKDTWRPIEYIFTGLNDIKPAMIEEATKKARQVAEKFAQDSNSAVGKIKRANQGVFSISNRDQNTPYVKIVRVVTTIDYFLKD